VTTGTPPRLAKLNPEIPRDLATIVQKAIDRDPRLRYQSAREFGDDLSRFLTDVPVRARRSGFLERTWRWCRRNPYVAGLTGTVAALVAIVMVGALLSAFWLNAERQATRKQLQLTTKAEGDARKAEGEARLQLYHSRVDAARANRMSRRSGQRFKSLEVLAEASRMANSLSLPEKDLLELRNETIACLALPDAQVQRTWSGWPPGTVWAEFDAAFERYARTDRKGNAHLHRAADGSEIWTLAGAGPGESFANFSPLGQYLIHGGRVWDLTGPSPVLLMERPAEGHAFAPDDGQLACHGSDGKLRLLALPEGNETAHFDTRVIGVYMAYHPQGRLLALSHQSGIQVRDLDSGEVKELPVEGGAGFVGWSPDGKLLAAECANYIIQIWDIASGKRVLQLTGHKNGGIRLAFSRSGDVLASSDWDGILRLWDPHTGEQLFQARLGAAVPHFLFDDNHVTAYVPRDGNLGILEIAPVRKFYRTLVRDPALGQERYYAPAISPDGRLLAVGMGDGVGFWDLAGGKPLAFLPLGVNYCVLFEPSGPLLTSGPKGVLRWPVQVDPVGSDVVRIGEPEPLSLPGGSANISMSRDGRIVAKAMSLGGLIWRRELPEEPLVLGPHGDTRSVAVSPDGKWVATGSHLGPNVKIWDSATGKLVHELVLEIMNGVYFSPDGRWLVTTSGGTSLWSTESWNKVRFIDAGNNAVGFSPDGKILAVESLHGAVRLVNPETGREYASLEDPHQDAAHRIAFTPDGTRLVATNLTSGSVHIWDLRAIRAELSEMGLDWDLPPYPPAAPDAYRPLTAVMLPDGFSVKAGSPQQ
jgi:WD40 repeat protein